MNKIPCNHRGYIIRYFDEASGVSFYINDRGTQPKFDDVLKKATVLISYTTALNLLTRAAKTVLSKYDKPLKKGYFYISKVFYSDLKMYNGGIIRIATKLTKPDRHDFLKAI